MDYEAAWAIAEQRTQDVQARCDMLEAENEQLRAAVELSIRSHENLAEFVLTGEYREEARRICRQLQAALTSGAMSPPGGDA